MEAGMIGLRSFCVAAVLALTPVALHAGEREDIASAAHAAFVAYTGKGKEAVADWERPIFSRRTAALIAAWEKGLKSDEVEDLNDFGWFCECQDFDEAKFKADLTVHHTVGKARALVDAAVDIGFGEAPRTLHLAMVREHGRWLIDDMRSASYPKGLQRELRIAIARHRKGE